MDDLSIKQDDKGENWIVKCNTKKFSNKLESIGGSFNKKEGSFKIPLKKKSDIEEIFGIEIDLEDDSSTKSKNNTPKKKKSLSKTKEKKESKKKESKGSGHKDSESESFRESEISRESSKDSSSKDSESHRESASFRDSESHRDSDSDNSGDEKEDEDTDVYELAYTVRDQNKKIEKMEERLKRFETILDLLLSSRDKKSPKKTRK